MKSFWFLSGLLALGFSFLSGMALPFSTNALAATPTAVSQPDQVNTTLSPDGQWTAIVNTTAGSLTLADWRHNQTEIFPEGSGVSEIRWSPDSRRLLAVRTDWLRLQSQPAISVTGPIELWRLDLDLQSRTVSTPTLLYKPAERDYANDIAPPPQQIVFGQWAPTSRYVLFGISLLSASVLADGIPPLVLDTETGQVYPVVRPALPAGKSPLELGRDNTALVNPRYHSWSPDGTRLAITAGGYRSAQVNKWLNIFETTTGRTTTVISQTEQIPGIVAWSPRGDIIAYAAVEAELTGDDWADWSSFDDNPAIAARRIYLLDPVTGEQRRLNKIEAYQDAPVWNSSGEKLYYVQRDGDQLKLMRADPATGQAKAVPGAVEPLDLQDPMQPNVGYYGQFGREALLSFIPADKVGAVAAGWVITGAGRRRPVNDLPLWVGDESGDTITHRTDEQYGHFVLTGLPSGLTRVRNSHLEFEVPVATITNTVDLGLLHYPLIHPPAYYGWSAAPLPDKSALLTQSQPISFTLCYTNATWQRPSLAEQQAEVWSKRPFSHQTPEWLKWWFEQPAVLYDSQAIFAQSYPDGPSLDALTSEWRYLLGLWSDSQFTFAPEDESNLALPQLIPQTDCAYNGDALDDLLARRQLEVWLMGYRAVEVRRLDKSKAGYDKMTLCDLDDVTCTERPGYHFSLQVEPAAGYQIIRFPGVEEVVTIHLLDDRGEEILDLPQVQPDRWN
ncbi:MAG TPA: hypothetical protein PKE64_03835 [Anaerolineae bacterium]|nr:hypothetical protein [Anaerolineae bacterium]